MNDVEEKKNVIFSDGVAPYTVKEAVQESLSVIPEKTWDEVHKVGVCTITVAVAAGQEANGTVSGGGEYKIGQTATITATPAAGKAFEKWSDNDTNATRTVNVIGDATYTASFTTAG